MEWWLNHVGQMAQSVQDYSAMKGKQKIIYLLLKLRLYGVLDKLL